MDYSKVISVMKYISKKLNKDGKQSAKDEWRIAKVRGF
jgi:hypothetical protein